MGTLSFHFEGRPVASEALYIGPERFADLCDAIDSVHAHLERQYESVKAELDRVLGEMEDER